jgi:c-di-GMP-binding flagellar brake protein YcgR
MDLERHKSLEELPMIERRKESRFVEKNSVLIWPASDLDNGPGINAYTYDISTGGARIYSKHPYSVGIVIKLQIHLARSKQSITLQAEVKWTRYKEEEKVHELGVEFRHQITSTLFALIKHLYNPDEGIPASIL